MKPICGGNPASRAVAICSGMAMAASVKPATASGPRSRQRQPANDRNNGQGLSGAAAGGAFIASSALQARLASRRRIQDNRRPAVNEGE